ncbi:hypothetical protein JFPO14_contig00008-0007 [Edwardsiella piscicida]|nr:hypothetical protein HI13_contig00009-0007 [Edwardsiella piscicida]GBK54843.1 hypothetical protein JFPO13_contig000011-0113 [Edwardsiella piscicida]GBK57932.1 hypothetical protein JFPO14_contig00008-0007 [Edwardsiella piscicida]
MAQYMKQQNSNTLRPAVQGDLDTLCGLYSVVNALSWLHPRLRRKPLFRAIVHWFSQEYDITVCLTTGTEPDQLDAMLDFLRTRCQQRWPFTFSKPFMDIPKLSTRHILTQCQQWLDHHPDRVVLLGDQYHWTVVSHMDSEWLYFFDSYTYRRIHRSRWSLREERGKHQLYRQAIYFIERGASNHDHE